MNIIKFSGDDEMGLRIWTPSAIESFIKQVQTDLTATAYMVHDGMKAKGEAFLSQTELRAFKDFHKEVSDWIASKPSKYWGANVDRGVDYQKRIAQWRDILVTRGATQIGPAPTVPGEHRIMPDFPALSSGVKIALGIGAGAVLILALSNLAGKISPSRQQPNP